MIYGDKRTCPFCRKRIDAKATVCSFCTRDVRPAKEISVGKVIILGGLVLFIFAMCRAPAHSDVTTSVATPGPATTTPEPQGWQAGVACVYNRSDDRFIGAFIASKPAPDGVNHLVTVAVDPELDPSGSIRPGTTWELTVPKNAVVKACKTD